MRDEMKAPEQNHTWEIVNILKGKKAIGCKWVFKVKYKSDGSVERYKARLVAKRQGLRRHHPQSEKICFRSHFRYRFKFSQTVESLYGEKYQTLSQFMNAPWKSHMEVATCVVRYLKGNPRLGIFLAATNRTDLECFSKKQPTVSKSSAEAEYRALGSAISEVTWLTCMLKDLDVRGLEPVRVYYDSKAAIHIASNPIFHERQSTSR
ncbi:uncharacterized protein LOC114736151 [Neltuma alba]|uniref:uncharacterized protein LOC114736151 n=1 Tax=Neltuma alba TaxID=207710 RepID=UPI0010A38996|nr:uncharacterized protein LOC114736151 [Prosopis alba]